MRWLRETLSLISKKTGYSVQQLREINGGKDLILVGQKLVLPASTQSCSPEAGQQNAATDSGDKTKVDKSQSLGQRFINGVKDRYNKIFSSNDKPVEYANSRTKVKIPGQESPVGIGEAFKVTQEDVDESKEKAQQRAEKLKESGKYPSPYTKVKGKDVLTRVVVSTDDNRTYIYDNKGNLTHAFKNATGAFMFKTHKGLRKVSGIETFPFSVGKRGEASREDGTNNAFGPYVVVNSPVDTETGRTKACNGEFLHGTNKNYSIGWNLSHGCMRHRNSDMFVLKDLLRGGDYINIV